MEGIKKATSSSIWEYEFEKEPIPNKGDYNVVTDWDGNARCIIRTTAVTVLPFKEITYDLCKKEGEDDSLDSWRKNHISFFEADGKEMGSLSVSEILFLIINGIVIALFTGFILTRNKTKFVTRIWFCRVGLIVSLIVMILGINGM